MVLIGPAIARPLPTGSVRPSAPRRGPRRPRGSQRRAQPGANRPYRDRPMIGLTLVTLVAALGSGLRGAIRARSRTRSLPTTDPAVSGDNGEASRSPSNVSYRRVGLRQTRWSVFAATRGSSSATRSKVTGSTRRSRRASTGSTARPETIPVGAADRRRRDRQQDFADDNGPRGRRRARDQVPDRRPRARSPSGRSRTRLDLEARPDRRQGDDRQERLRPYVRPAHRPSRPRQPSARRATRPSRCPRRRAPSTGSPGSRSLPREEWIDERVTAINHAVEPALRPARARRSSSASSGC